jgi:hypothetical protein
MTGSFATECKRPIVVTSIGGAVITPVDVGLVVLALCGTWVPMWVALVPRVGVRPLALLWPIRFVVGAATVGTAAALYASNPSFGPLLTLSLTCLLALVSCVANPARVFRSLDDPPHLAAADADLGGDAAVVGIEVGDAACAWAVELVVPHHLVNDRVGGTPLLVAW